MENEENYEIEKRYSLSRHIEGIKNAPLLETNKEALLKFIEYESSKGKKYIESLSMLINIIREVNDIDLTSLDEEGVIKTFEKLNNIRWLYSASSFTTLKQRWIEFLEFISRTYKLKLDIKPLAKKFNLKLRSQYMTISKPIEYQHGN